MLEGEEREMNRWEQKVKGTGEERRGSTGMSEEERVGKGGEKKGKKSKGR